MFRLRLALTCLLLTVICWLGITPPATAQISFTMAIAETTPGGMTLFSFAGQRPATLGVKEGSLAACPNTPNCVNSQSSDTDGEHKVEPLTYSSSPAEALADLKLVIQSMARTKIITEADHYIYAEFTSTLMGFVDDVEFYLDQSAGVIHVRSASRLGQSDLGVNRKRIETIRAKLAASQS